MRQWRKAIALIFFEFVHNKIDMPSDSTAIFPGHRLFNNLCDGIGIITYQFSC